MKTEITY